MVFWIISRSRDLAHLVACKDFINSEIRINLLNFTSRFYGSGPGFEPLEQSFASCLFVKFACTR